MAHRWYHWHVTFYFHFATAARGKGIKVSAVTCDDALPLPIAYACLKATLPNADTLVDASRTVCIEQSHGKARPIDLPEAFIIGKVPMDDAYGGSDGPASWSKRNAYLPLEPRANRVEKAR